jgi:hypothetical protein
MSILSSSPSLLLGVVSAVAALLLLCTGAQAQWTCTTSQTCDGATNSRCTNSWFMQNRDNIINNPNVNNMGNIYLGCLDDGKTCCNDPCTVFFTASTCLSLTESVGSSSPMCIFMPDTKTSYQCISKVKMCAINPVADGSCDRVPLCQADNVTGNCQLKVTYTAAQVQDYSLATCPALAGVVVAFLVLMFISLIGAIIFVVIVVVVKQRRADEEEKKAAEEAAAAEAAAKAQQEEQADF